MIWSLVLLSVLKASLAIRRIDRRLVESSVEKRNSTQSLKPRKAQVSVNVPTHPDGHLVKGPLPLTKDGEALTTRNWAGHVPASGDGHKYFFYWLFEPETVDDNTPLLIWLNGGPACSSMDGLFLENGPIQWTVVDGHYMLQRNPYSWHKAPAYTLYIDQPVGTGLSFTTNEQYPTNDLEINIDFHYFLTSFFDLHADKFVEDGFVWRKLFFSGESHAGHYIPSMMNYILDQNRLGARLNIPLAGAAIGNGWIDPIHQYAAAEAAYGHGLIDLPQRNYFASYEQACQRKLRDHSHGRAPPVCYALLDDIIDQAFGKQSHMKVSLYDVRISERKHTPRKFPKGYHITECYLGGWKLPKDEGEGTMDTSVMNAVLHAIHATAAIDAGQRYEECTDPPYDALTPEETKGVVADIVQVLHHSSKPRMLFFNGVEDLICNHVGNEKVLENLPWNGRDEWIVAQRYAWLPHADAAPAGFMKEFENLLFLKVLNAGHMVPMDLPETSLEMMKIFVSGQSFTKSVQKLDSAATALPQSCVECATCPLPSENECPRCPGTGKAGDCSEEIAEATDHLLADLRKDEAGTGTTISPAPVVGAIILVVLTIMYGLMEMWKRNRLERPVGVADLEMQPRYRDQPAEDAPEDTSSNGMT